MKQKPELKELDLNEIEATAGTQVRRALDKAVIHDYGEAMLAGALFPSLTVFSPKKSERYILADGFHRLEAAKDCGYESFPCEVFSGSVHDALEFALGANTEHGLRRSNKDKRHAVELACKDPEWSKWSADEIARLVRVSGQLVRNIRTELNITPETTQTKDGTKRKGTNKKKAKKANGDAIPTVGIDTANRKDILGVLGLVMSLPFDGKEAVERLGLKEMKGEFEYCRDWFKEAADACE